MKKFKLYPYKMHSKSASLISIGLRCLRIRQQNTYRPRPNHIIINWGNTNWPSWHSNNILNAPDHVQVACNKLHTFTMLKAANIPTPDWTTKTEEAQQWVDEGHKIFGRHTLTGHSGQGILLFDHETITSNLICPLYTKYTKCKHEYRVHVMNNQAIDYVMKKKRNDITPEQEHLVNLYIRSHICTN